MCFIFVGILAVTVITGVLFRNIGVPVVWLGELGTFSTIWVTFLGIGLAYRHKMHPNVDLVTHLIKPEQKIYFEMFWDVIAAVIALMIIISAISFMEYLKLNGHTSGELGWQFFYVYIIPYIGIASVVLFAIESFWDSLEALFVRKSTKRKEGST
jgi:TRAP-type C4-dicarboxylate transport system permease small subunit